MLPDTDEDIDTPLIFTNLNASMNESYSKATDCFDIQDVGARRSNISVFTTSSLYLALM
jgi:hypothetical protein